jgi:hypothetical protein
MTEDKDRRTAQTVAGEQDQRPAPATARVKVWTGLGTVLLAGTALSLLPQASQAGAPGKLATPGASAPSLIQMAAGEGGEGGEGGGAAKAVDLSTDDVAYLTQLGLMRGHLEVGMELYRQGEQKAAAPHMEHPIEELYDPLEPALEKRGAAEFKKQLEALERLVADGAPLDQVEAAYKAALSSVGAAEKAVPEAKRLALATGFAVMVNLVRTAAAEYDAAVDKKGRVVQPVEYQDALGFVRTAEAMLDQTPAAERARAADAIARAKAQFEAIAGLWPSLVPPAVVESDPSKLFGAAAYIEIAGLHVK